MNTLNALYDFLEDKIDAALPSSPLYQVDLGRTARKSVEQSKKIIRVFGAAGTLVPTEDAKSQEVNIEMTIQCMVRPESVELEDLEAAMVESMGLAKAVSFAIAADTSLGGGVCDAMFNEFDWGTTNLGAAVMGCTYLDGVINGAS